MARATGDRQRIILSKMQERARPRWRRLATSLLPTVYEDTGEARPSTYTFISFLGCACEKAHAMGDTEFLRKAYAFVYWAYDHPSNDIWNPACVSFLEHSFEHCLTVDDARKIAAWMRRDMIETAVELMKYLGKSDDLVSLVEKAAKDLRQVHVGDVNRTLQAHLQMSGVH